MAANRNNKCRRAEEMRKLLVEKFPACFAPKGAQKRPLKIGIMEDLVAAFPDVPRSKIGTGLYDYTSGPTYIGNLKAGAERIDLDGNPVGIVTEDEEKSAAHRMLWFAADRKRIEAMKSLRTVLGELITAAEFALETPGMINGRDQLRAAVDAAKAV